MPKKQEPLLTCKQAAELLQVHEWTVRRWIRENKLESVKIGHTRRIMREQLDKMIKAGKTGRK